MAEKLKKDIREKFDDDENKRLILIIILNRVLQTDNSPARKTQKQISKKCNCTIKKVIAFERFICTKLSEKSHVLMVLLSHN